MVVGMYGHEPPTRLKIRDLVLLEACPASGGSRTQMPKAQLARWVAVADAVGEWYRSEVGTENINDIEERQMGWLDPVQGGIASSLFATYRQIMSKTAGDIVELDSSFSEVWDTEANATIRAASQLSITRGDATERVKIKTGRSRVSPEEKAVLIEGADDPDVPSSRSTFRFGRSMTSPWERRSAPRRFPVSSRFQKRPRVRRGLFPACTVISVIVPCDAGSIRASIQVAPGPSREGCSSLRSGSPNSQPVNVRRHGPGCMAYQPTKATRTVSMPDWEAPSTKEPPQHYWPTIQTRHSLPTQPWKS
jgi:hypothetical protein